MTENKGCRCCRTRPSVLLPAHAGALQVSVVLETAVSKKSITARAQAPLAIGEPRHRRGVCMQQTGHMLCRCQLQLMLCPHLGSRDVPQGSNCRPPSPPPPAGFAVFCAHAVMLPIDGCSINPARSLGPAIVSGTWPGSFWVFMCVGGDAAAADACLLWRAAAAGPAGCTKQRGHHGGALLVLPALGAVVHSQ